jgi:hypothetical protein
MCEKPNGTQHQMGPNIAHDQNPQMGQQSS